MIYIESNVDRGVPKLFDSACALYGAEDLGLKWRLTSFDEIKSGRFDSLLRGNLCVGSVDFMREVFLRMGLVDVRLPLNSNRKHVVMTLGEVKSLVKDGMRLFIKPFEIKLFTGFVVDNSIYSCLEGMDDGVKLMVYDVFDSNILSEYRVYVHMGRVVDMRNYSGDFFVVPDSGWIKSVIDELSNFPVSYTIDVGILSSGENVVIEFNDMWAIGNYGIPNDIYLRMLRDRYFEIVSSGIKN